MKPLGEAATNFWERIFWKRSSTMRRDEDASLTTRILHHHKVWLESGLEWKKILQQRMRIDNGHRLRHVKREGVAARVKATDRHWAQCAIVDAHAL